MGSPALVAVGDISFGDHYASASIGIYSHLKRNAAANPLREVQDKISSAPVSFGNLETVLSESGLDSENLHSMHMRGRPDAVNLLVSSGFNVLNVANNHMLQHGADAFEETVDLLRKSSIGIVGLACPNGRNCIPFVTDINGRKAVFLGYAFEKDKYYSGTTLYAQGDGDTIIRDIQACKTKDNVVICSFHWGNEFITYSSMDQVRLARRAIDAGCDLILGHHPHVLNGYEYWNNGLIFYSLGNFLFDQLWNPLCREGCLLELGLEERRFKLMRAWVTKIGNDFTVRVDGSERRAERRFEQLNKKLVEALASNGAHYDRDRSAAERRNRYQSWAYLARNVSRYDSKILRQIIADTVKKKFTRDFTQVS